MEELNKFEEIMFEILALLLLTIICILVVFVAIPVAICLWAIEIVFTSPVLLSILGIVLIYFILR